MAKLILRSTDEEFSLDESGSITVGRDAKCDITIDDTQASRRHCSVVRLQKGYEVADLGSTNGTLVNSTLIKRKKLRHGDVIRIGDVEIQFSDPGAAEAPAGGERDNCVLIYAKGGRKGQKIELAEQRTTIGRKATNTVPIDDPVASSYHCEIVRDLNGYTIRDLGSTNGTLVNSEMITEAQLQHGARVRIGNTRFVFQDPAMAEIDLELAGVEDDEADWGMMRELDLAAVRRRNPATIFYLVLFVGILGALGYLLTVKKGPVIDTGLEAPKGNLHDPFSFETPSTRFAWRSDPAGAVRFAIQTATKGQGKSALEMKPQAGAADSFYGNVLNGTNITYRLKAKAAVRGGSGQIGIQWSGLGLKRWSRVPIASGSLSDIEIEASSPPWALTARLGVSCDGTVILDDVSIVRVGPARSTEAEQNEFRVAVTDGRDIDVSHARAPILANGRPFARDGSGNEVDASALSVSCTAADKEHAVITIDNAGGAAVVGVEFEEVSGYLSRGGFRAFGFKAAGSDETYFQASFPTEGGVELKEVRKLLLGPSGRAIAVVAADNQARLSSEARVDGKRRLWAIFGAPEGGKYSFRFKTDLRGDTAAANAAMTAALNLFRGERWGEFQRAAQGALAEFPFANRAMRRQLFGHIGTVNQEYGKLIRELDRHIKDYDEFKDLQSLVEGRRIIQTLRRKFQVEPGVGPRGKTLEKLAMAESKKRGAALRKQQGEEATSRMEQAEFIHIPQGEIYSAALFYSYVAWYLPDSPQAQGAKNELAKIEKDNPHVLQVLRKLGLERKG